MPTIETSPPPIEDLAARQLIAAALGIALREPRWFVEHPVQVASATAALADAWDLVSRQVADLKPSALGLGEIRPDRIRTEPLVGWLNTDPRLRESVYTKVFGLLVSRSCPPYETEYCASRDTTFRAQHLADIAGFFNAFGLEPDPDSPDRADSASLELSFAAFLLEKIVRLRASGQGDPADERENICAEALTAFVRDHMVWWMPTFARTVERHVESLAGSSETSQLQERKALDDLVGVMRLLRGYLTVERTLAGLDPARRIVEPSVAQIDPCAEHCHTCTTS